MSDTLGSLLGSAGTRVFETSGKNKVKFIIDSRDESYVRMYKWGAQKDKNGNFYVCRRVWGYNKKPVTELLHRTIGASEGSRYVDHKNGNTLDNRRENLRPCTPAQNTYNCKKYKNNTTGYKGVSYIKTRGTYRARIRVDNQEIHLGEWETPEAAYFMYMMASRERHGEFSRVE